MITWKVKGKLFHRVPCTTYVSADNPFTAFIKSGFIFDETLVITQNKLTAAQEFNNLILSSEECENYV